MEKLLTKIIISLEFTQICKIRIGKFMVIALKIHDIQKYATEKIRKVKTTAAELTKEKHI